MRWRLIIEEFGPELKYIKGENNVVADTLSRLEKSPNQEILNISELYGYDDKDLPDRAYPIRYHDISKEQETDAKLQQKLVSHKYSTLDTFGAHPSSHIWHFWKLMQLMGREAQSAFATCHGRS